MWDDYLADHALLTASWALLQWTGFALLVWPWLVRLPLYQQLGGAVTAALGLCIGLIANFQAHFLGVVGWGQGFGLLPLWLLTTVLIAWSWPALAWAQGQMPGMARPPTPQAGSLWGRLAFALGLGWFALQVGRDVPGVFDTWDAVVSWNRWATEWFHGHPPVYTMGYPQLLPTAMAGLYATMGNSDVQPVARIFMLLFALTPCLLLWDGYRRWRYDAFVWAAGAWLVLLACVFPDLVDSGYADVPGACFVAITGYFLLLGTTGQLPPRASLWLGAVAAIAAVLTKQPSGIAWLMWVGVAAKFWRQHPQTRVTSACSSAWFMLLVAPWFLYTAWRIHTGADVTNIGYLVNTIHGQHSLTDRMLHALNGPLMTALAGLGSAPAAAVCLTGLLALACTNRWGRWLVLAICLPYMGIWAALFSYDARNLLPALGPMSLALGIGISQGIQLLRKKMPWTVSINTDFLQIKSSLKSTHFITYKWLSSALCIILLALFAVYPVKISDIAQRQNALQHVAGNPQLNQRLQDFAKAPGYSGLVITTYTPMVMVKMLRPHVVPLTRNPNAAIPLLAALIEGQRPLCDMLGLAPETLQGVRYLLLHRHYVEPIINAALAAGTLHLHFEQDGWRLMQIECPNLPGLPTHAPFKQPA